MLRQNKFLCLFFVAFWLLGSNLPVAESLFTALHDLIDHNHGKNTNSEFHIHHTAHHSTHPLSHENQHKHEHQPGDDCFIKTIAIISSVSILKNKNISDSTSVFFTNIASNFNYSYLAGSYYKNYPPPALSEYISKLTTRAPPALI